MALRDFWRRGPERTHFPLDPVSRDSWHEEAEARYTNQHGEHRYRHYPASFDDESRHFNDRWQNAYSGPGYQRFGGSQSQYGGSSDNPFLGDRPLTRAGSMYDSDYFGHGGLPKTPWRGEGEIPARDEPLYGGRNPAEGELPPWQEREFGKFRGLGPRGYRRSDERIKEDVCQCLTDDSHIDASDIDVTVNDREVLLSGTVQTRAEKRRAEDMIERIPGVRDVINGLRVSSETRSMTEGTQTRQGSFR